MEKSVSLDRVFGDVSFYERFALAATAGFSRVEVGEWTNLDLTQVGEALERHSLRLAAMSGSGGYDLSNNVSHGDFREFLSQAMAVAKSLECKGLIIESKTGSTAITASLSDTTILAREDLRNAAIATRVLMSVAQRAERNGIILYLKTPFTLSDGHGFLASLRLSGNVVAAVNSPALRLLLDSTELWKCRNEPEAANVMRRINGLLGYIHLGERTPAGEWTEELAWFRKSILSFYEYSGSICLNYPATSEDQAILADFKSL